MIKSSIFLSSNPGFFSRIAMIGNEKWDEQVFRTGERLIP